MRCGVFPGQGNQYVNMGRDLYDAFDKARAMYDLASQITGIDIKGISFEGPEDIQRETLNTQLITFVHSCVVHHLLTNDFDKVLFSQFAGHSIGEYAALVAGGVFSFEDGVRIVQKRGELMKIISFDKPSLVAVHGVDRQSVDDFCNNETQGELEVALYNAPGNYVIGGLPEALEKYMHEIPGRRKIPLRVSGPFHTSHYKYIADDFQDFLSKFKFKKPKVRVYSNVTAQPHKKEAIIDKLVEQLYNPVLWEDTIRAMTCKFFEIGPGKSLANFIVRIRENPITYLVHDLKTLEKAKNLL